MMGQEKEEHKDWWVERWLQLLDSYRFKKRLERARVYSREGNVLSIDFIGSGVRAKVQGSETEPYEVSLSLEPFTDEDWDYVCSIMTEKAIFSAQLLAGQMPDEIEQAFIAAGLSLFPFSLSDIKSRCTCADKANPCKHIGAIYYQLADRFKEDPFVLFQLRGRTKTQILETLRHKRSQKNPSGEGDKIISQAFDSIQEQASKVAVDLEKFWHYDRSLDPSLVVISEPVNNISVLDSLGTFRLPVEEAEAVKAFLEPIYRTVRQKAVMRAMDTDSD
ncbi:MAG: hypothetical protein N5P05_002434 [Chroococcopsis gigantea SAG 12.99]|jgi:uncharacterized Zn finger protein|nr:hypothetical protein [Chroococcopsis gigantea SAG 12.99]